MGSLGCEVVNGSSHRMNSQIWLMSNLLTHQLEFILAVPDQAIDSRLTLDAGSTKSGMTLPQFKGAAGFVARLVRQQKLARDRQ